MRKIKLKSNCLDKYEDIIYWSIALAFVLGVFCSAVWGAARGSGTYTRCIGSPCESLYLPVSREEPGYLTDNSTNSVNRNSIIISSAINRLETSASISSATISSYFEVLSTASIHGLLQARGGILSTGTISGILAAGATSYIANQNALISGTRLHVSSVGVSGNVNITGHLASSGPVTLGDAAGDNLDIRGSSVTLFNAAGFHLLRSTTFYLDSDNLAFSTGILSTERLLTLYKNTGDIVIGTSTVDTRLIPATNGRLLQFQETGEDFETRDFGISFKSYRTNSEARVSVSDGNGIRIDVGGNSTGSNNYIVFGTESSNNDFTPATQMILPASQITAGGAVCINSSRVLTKCTSAVDASGDCTCP